MTRDDSPILIYETSTGLSRTTLSSDDVTLGRDGGCDVRLDHPTVSRRHARLVRDGGERWRYEDLASRNGTRAGSDAAELENGALIRLGRVRAWFFLEAPPADWAPDDEPPAFAWAIGAAVKKNGSRGVILTAIGGGVLGVATSFVIWSLALNDGAWPW